jgi:hypothetical protein
MTLARGRGMAKRLAITLVLLLGSVVFPAAAQERSTGASTQGDLEYRSAIEFSPISPLIRIYAVQYARRLDDRDELLLGFAYANIKYDHGRSHAPSGILGYRRYFWKKAHVEYQLWPSYNWYFETDEQRYYNGPELWNEFRPGYTFDFHVGSTPVFLNVQYLIGFGLYGGNKPQSFKDQADREGAIFAMPVFFLGWRF